MSSRKTSGVASKRIEIVIRLSTAGGSQRQHPALDHPVREALVADWRLWRVDWRVLPLNMGTVASTLRVKAKLGEQMIKTEVKERKESAYPATFPSKAFLR
jgi:hypothetical protein